MGYGWACVMLWCHGWGCKPPLTVSHILLDVYSVFLHPWDAVGGHMGASIAVLHLHVQVEVNFRKTVPNTWGNTQYMTAVKLMPGGVWRWQYTRVTHAPRHWSWISWPTLSSCINRRGTAITSRYTSRAQHLIPFQNSRGIITDTVVEG